MSYSKYVRLKVILEDKFPLCIVLSGAAGYIHNSLLMSFTVYKFVTDDESVQSAVYFPILVSGSANKIKLK